MFRIARIVRRSPRRARVAWRRWKPSAFSRPRVIDLCDNSVVNRRHFLAASGLLAASRARAADRPNIVWLTPEDHGPQLGCYGYPLVSTPNIDRLASEGVRFTRFFTTAPVCSASRSA